MIFSFLWLDLLVNTFPSFSYVPRLLPAHCAVPPSAYAARRRQNASVRSAPSSSSRSYATSRSCHCTHHFCAGNKHRSRGWKGKKLKYKTLQRHTNTTSHRTPPTHLQPPTHPTPLTPASHHPSTSRPRAPAANSPSASRSANKPPKPRNPRTRTPQTCPPSRRRRTCPRSRASSNRSRPPASTSCAKQACESRAASGAPGGSLGATTTLRMRSLSWAEGWRGTIRGLRAGRARRRRRRGVRWMMGMMLRRRRGWRGKARRVVEVMRSSWWRLSRGGRVGVEVDDEERGGTPCMCTCCEWA